MIIAIAAGAISSFQTETARTPTPTLKTPASFDVEIQPTEASKMAPRTRVLRPSNDLSIIQPAAFRVGLTDKTCLQICQESLHAKPRVASTLTLAMNGSEISLRRQNRTRRYRSARSY